LGLGYNTSAIESFIQKTEIASAINKDQLRPALVQLVTTTLDAQKSMKLLNVAMDISASTGASLDSTTTALSRAFNGNFASLGKLQTAFTSSELEAMGFEKAVEALNDLFKGSAQANADSYAGKLDKLQIAANNAKEEIGKGLVDAISVLASGNYDSGLQSIVDFGEKIGDVFQRAAISIGRTKFLLSTGFTLDEKEMAQLDAFTNLLRNPDALTSQASNNPAGNRKFLADYKKQTTLQKKIEADRKKAAALAAKADKERLKREKEAQMLKRAGTVFDMENIQIVAAMQGQIDGEQRLRLVALLAINNDMADAAEKTSRAVLALNAPALANLGVIIKAGDSVTDVIGRLLQAQAKVALLDLGIKDLPKAKNPFEDWISIMAKIMADLDTIAAKIRNMPTLAKPNSSSSSSSSTSSNSSSSSSNSSSSSSTLVPNPFNPSSNPITISSAISAIDTLTNLRANTPSGTPISFLLKEHIDTLTDSLTLSSMSNLSDEQARLRAMGYFDTPGITAGSLFDPSAFRRREEGLPPITVIVQGSVISEQDLSTAITNQIYEQQKAGQGITISSTSI
jgi:hypothetical protein